MSYEKCTFSDGSKDSKSAMAAVVAGGNGEASDKKVALITGITGQDGSYLAEFLIEKGYEVRHKKM